MHRSKLPKDRNDSSQPLALQQTFGRLSMVLLHSFLGLQQLRSARNFGTRGVGDEAREDRRSARQERTPRGRSVKQSRFRSTAQ